MKKLLAISLIVLFIFAGCSECGQHISSSENVECQRLKFLWKRAGNENPQIIIPEAENESGYEMTWQELGETVFSAVGCCFCKHHPLAKEWTECNRLECIWEYLEKENIQSIAFYEQVLEENTERPEDWHNLWAEINEPKKIKKVIKLLRKAIKKEKNKFVNEDIVVSAAYRMQIITDKHKFIVPISCYKGAVAVRGIGWTSQELNENLQEWGCGNQIRKL